MSAGLELLGAGLEFQRIEHLPELGSSTVAFVFQHSPGARSIGDSKKLCHFIPKIDVRGLTK